MSYQAVDWVLNFSRSSGSTRLVAVAIASHADAGGGRSWPSIAAIVMEARVARASVYRALGELERLGELVITGVDGKGRERTRGGGRGVRNHYRLCCVGQQAALPFAGAPKGSHRATKRSHGATAPVHQDAPNSRPEKHLGPPAPRGTVLKPSPNSNSKPGPQKTRPVSPSRVLTAPQRRYADTGCLIDHAERLIRSGPIGFADLREELKCLAASKSIDYDGQMVSTAADIGERRARGIPAWPQVRAAGGLR
jgi:Helix-turn-helix domain